jgi:hypothetical protein
MTLLAFRPKSNRMIDFLMLALAVALRKHGPITIPQKVVASQWRKDRVVWSYMADGSIRFEVEELRKEATK